MTTISGPRRSVPTSSTQSTSSVSAPATQQPAAQTTKAPGDTYSTSAAATSSSTPSKTLSEGKEQLARFPASADRDLVSKVLNKSMGSPGEVDKAMEAVNRMLKDAPEGMTEGDLKKLEKALAFKQNLFQMMKMIDDNLQRAAEEARKRRKANESK